MENISLYKNEIKLPHSQTSELMTADCVSITFISQKNGYKNATITQWRKNNKVICPVIQWAALVYHISLYPGAMLETSVSAVWVRNQLLHVTSKIVESALRNGIVAVGKAKLCIHHHKVGTHSICAGAAMAMYLRGVPVFAIMLIGRWSSTAFMNYIWKQIEEFTFKV